VEDRVRGNKIVGGVFMVRKVLLITIMLVVLTPMFFAAGNTGYLSVKAADGVEILVNGKLFGVVKDGQLFLELAAGTYDVTAQGYGFTSETIRNVKIEPLKARTLEISLKKYKVISEQLPGKLQIDLIRKYGTVRIFSIPFNGAGVTINGESYGETDIELTYFPVGVLSIDVGGPDKNKLTGLFSLEENSVLTLLADFIDKKIYQIYEVSFDFPAGVEAMIDNTKIARNIPSAFIGGTYSVELTARNSSQFEEITRREIVISKSGFYYLEPNDKPVQEKMVLVEKGSFTMGDTDEKPTHKVTFTYNFYIGKYETTFDEYDAFCETTGRSKPKDEGWGRGSRPVIKVSWNDAIAYCNWLSEKEKIPKAYDDKGNFLDKDGMITTDPSKVVGYRLPTEAEWEYAARGGNKSRGYQYAGSSTVGDVAWYDSNSGNKTQEVGKKAPNELGIYDMSGNVWEWCSDWYGNYSSSAQTNPYNSTAGSYRVVRGGSCYNDATVTRVAGRNVNTPTLTYSDLGFRIARTVP
jgi:formylglycine-generating enzyme required for sulfatase activity